MSAPGPALPASLAANPRLSAWLDFSRDGEVVIRSGKVEYGQGIWTALAQIAAEELGVGMDRIRVAPVSTATSPNEGITSGSKSVEDSGSALRAACAQAREAVLAAAAAALGTAAAALAVDDGQVTSGGRGTGLSYWSPGVQPLLERDATGEVPARPAGQWSVAGHSAHRIDLPDKVTGRPRFLHDLVLAGMAYGRVVRPPAPAARLTDPGSPELPEGTVLVRDGSFLGVIAPADRAAVRAAARLARTARWQVSESLPDERDLAAFLRSAHRNNSPPETRHNHLGVRPSRRLEAGD